MRFRQEYKDEGTLEEVMLPPSPQRIYRVGAIKVPVNFLKEISFLLTDTQGQLQDKGVFDVVHKALLLPENYTVLAMFFEYMRWQDWRIIVESPDLPVLERYLEPPEITPVYRRNPDGTNSLIEIRH